MIQRGEDFIEQEYSFYFQFKYFSGLGFIGIYPIIPSKSTDSRPKSFKADILEKKNPENADRTFWH